MQRLQGYWQQFLGIVDTSLGEEGGIWNKKILVLSLLLSVVGNVINFFRCYSLFHQDEPCNPYSIPFGLGLASIHMFDTRKTFYAENV
jgi:hypothetical protein